MSLADRGRPRDRSETHPTGAKSSLEATLEVRDLLNHDPSGMCNPHSLLTCRAHTVLHNRKQAARMCASHVWIGEQQYEPAVDG